MSTTSSKVAPPSPTYASEHCFHNLRSYIHTEAPPPDHPILVPTCPICYTELYVGGLAPQNPPSSPDDDASDEDGWVLSESSEDGDVSDEVDSAYDSEDDSSDEEDPDEKCPPHDQHAYVFFCTHIVCIPCHNKLVNVATSNIISCPVCRTEQRARACGHPIVARIAPIDRDEALDMPKTEMECAKIDFCGWDKCVRGDWEYIYGVEESEGEDETDGTWRNQAVDNTGDEDRGLGFYDDDDDDDDDDGLDTAVTRGPADRPT
ncbi:hypothetical protein OQA88_5792 [Cercophora sp. LCS_1]